MWLLSLLSRPENGSWGVRNMHNDWKVVTVEIQLIWSLLLIILFLIFIRIFLWVLVEEAIRSPGWERSWVFSPLDYFVGWKQTGSLSSQTWSRPAPAPTPTPRNLGQCSRQSRDAGPSHPPSASGPDGPLLAPAARHRPLSSLLKLWVIWYPTIDKWHEL